MGVSDGRPKDVLDVPNWTSKGEAAKPKDVQLRTSKTSGESGLSMLKGRPGRPGCPRCPALVLEPKVASVC